MYAVYNRRPSTTVLTILFGAILNGYVTEVFLKNIFLYQNVL